MLHASLKDDHVGLVQELLVSPYLLLQNNIPVVRCVQYPGEFIINYPGNALEHCGVSSHPRIAVLLLRSCLYLKPVWKAVDYPWANWWNTCTPIIRLKALDA